MEKKLIALVFVALLVGLGGGYGLGYVVYQPQILGFQSDLSTIKADVHDLKILTEDTTRNVNVTNWPTATNQLTAILNETFGGTIGPRISNASNEVAEIGDKNITFLGGGISGGVAWKSRFYYYGYTSGAGGGLPGAGRVEVYGSQGNILAQFALPLNSMFGVQNVDRIRVYAEVPIPSLTIGDYSAFVVATVYWIES